MKKITSIILTLILTTACGRSDSNFNTLTVAVAGSMKQAAEQLADEFMKFQPDSKIEVVPSASGTIVAQILNGAPFDLFMSADMKFPRAVYDKGYAVNSPEVYARGTLVVFSRHGLNFSNPLTTLSEMNIKKIAIANPDTAPYGKAAFEAMAGAGINTDGRIITAENVMQAASYGLSSADAAFISKSSLYTPALQKYRAGNYWAEVNPGLYTPLEHGIVILKNCRDMNLARAFHDFILSREGKRILEKNGFDTD